MRREISPLPLYRKNIIASLLKFAGYINNHEMLPGNIFVLILKNKMAARDVCSTLNKDFCWPPRAKGIIGGDLKFAGYVPHYKILTGNIYIFFNISLFLFPYVHLNYSREHV